MPQIKLLNQYAQANPSTGCDCSVVAITSSKNSKAGKEDIYPTIQPVSAVTEHIDLHIDKLQHEAFQKRCGLLCVFC